MLRTMTISYFHARKLIFQTCHPKSIPAYQLPPCSALPIDLWRRWYICTHNRKPLIWRLHTGLPLTQHSRGRRQWHAWTLPNSTSQWRSLDGRPYSREALVPTQHCPFWSVPLPMPIWFKPATLHSGRYAIHQSQWHLWLPRCYSICQRWWCTQPGRYTWTLKKLESIIYTIWLIKTLDHL